MQTPKTDNRNLPSKMALRRYFLNKFHSVDPISVLDCCQGNGVIWDQLRKEFNVASYWGVDLKPKKGRLRIDSVRILQQQGWPQNVIDIDTYGSPWKHWKALLETLSQPTTVFMTVGQVATGTVGALDSRVLRAAGLHFKSTKVPAAFQMKLRETLTDFILTTMPEGVRLVELAESGNLPNVRYIGARVEPSPKA